MESAVRPERNQKQSLDIWLIMVIGLLVMGIGGGLYLTGQTVMARIDEVEVRSVAQVSSMQTEVFLLRKQVQDLAAAQGRLVAAIEKQTAEQAAAALPPRAAAK